MKSYSAPPETRSEKQKAKIQTRSMLKQNETTRKSASALAEIKKKGRQKLNEKQSLETAVLVKDIYHTAMSTVNMIRGETGIIYDRRMSEHLCLWDKTYPECPERFTRVLERCEELNLIKRCKYIQPRSATKDEILTKHTEEQWNILMETSGSTNENHLEDISSRYDAIFIHPTTFDLSLLATGSTIELIENILFGNCQNGMAIIRPPGHHAMKAEYNGYCFFNNVAIAAEYALNKFNLKRILIIDWDVHHGQGTQRMFYDDPRVLYFSIHRFEYGTFWPNLRESDFDAIGENNGKGFNFNVPLNKIGMTNADYLAVFQQILMPVAIEFQPELVIVSAGYDGALGCPEYSPNLIIVSAGYDGALGDEKGEMELTPACYSHLLSPLLTLAEGKVAVILEGGYCLSSLAEGAALTLKTLLGDPCPIMEKLEIPCDSIQESILNCINVHKPYWKILQLQNTYNLEELNNINPQSNLHKIIKLFKGGPPVPEKFETRNCYPIQCTKFLKKTEDRLNHLKIITNLSFSINRVCYVYDDVMLQHKNLFEVGYVEGPERILKIKERLQEYNLFERMKLLKCRQAVTDELCLVHSYQHIAFIRNVVKEKQDDNLRCIGEKFNSVYLHPKTYECASFAAGSVLQVVDNVITGQSQSGICIIRPPGHHAESDMPHGFCIFNNVAIAAQYAIRDHNLKRILIIDWDVHHGNGIQHIFESNPNVLYISIHRYDNGSFFPMSTDGDYTVVGSGRGEGFNINIPWNKKGMGDMEYIAVFQSIIMPIAYEYQPELVLVSAGFDAAIGDPLGGCKVTPEAYGYFTHWLKALANGRIIICLEGGYNINSISYAMTMCTKALLGDPLPLLQTSFNNNNRNLNLSCIETIQNVLSIQKKYWKCLRFDKKLPEFNIKPDVEEDEIERSSMIPRPQPTQPLPTPIDEMFNLMKITNVTKGNHDADEQQNKSPGNSSSSPNDTQESSRDDEQQPGPSKPREIKQTLVDYLSENMQALANEEMFAVVPLNNCPHLSTLDPSKAPEQLNTKMPCENCESTVENWICLGCFKVFCGRYIMEHMLYHHLETEHPLTLSFSDLSVWCYKCEAYIENPCLYKYKNLAHLNKFNEELVWSYTNTTNELIHLDTTINDK